MRQAREIIRLKFSASVPKARDRAVSWARAFDGSGDVKSLGERRPCLAVAGGDGRRRPGEGALLQSQEQMGTPPPPEPDWPVIHRELKRKHLTLLIV
jgi:hypothetical protein